MATFPTFRAPMRARSIDADEYRGAIYAVEKGIAGIGEPLGGVPEDLEHALHLIAGAFGPKAARMLKRFAELPIGTPVWTRTGEDAFRLGRLKGPWSYDNSGEAKENGICQVRSTEWLAEEFSHSTVPQAVALTFARGGRNLQRINDPDTETETESILMGASG